MADRYNGRFGTVIFGHHAFIGEKNITKFNFAVGIDLGCVYGGYLVAMIINDIGYEVIKVKSKKRYSEYFQDE